MSAEGGGQVGSCGEAEDADAMRVDVPFGGVLANYAERALGILESRGGFGIRAGVGDAILQKDAGDADGGEPVADFGAFEVDSQDAVAAAGKDDYGGAGVLCGGCVQSNGGRGDIAEAD